MRKPLNSLAKCEVFRLSPCAWSKNAWTSSPVVSKLIALLYQLTQAIPSSLILCKYVGPMPLTFMSWSMVVKGLCSMTKGARTTLMYLMSLSSSTLAVFRSTCPG